MHYIAHHRRVGIATLAFVGSLLVGAPTFAAGVGGFVLDDAGAPLVDIEARLWSFDLVKKEYVPVHSAISAGTGAYLISNVPAGNYLLSFRVPPKSQLDYSDRWYDADDITNGGWRQESADLLSLTNSDTITGLDVRLLPTGRVSGRVLATDGAGAAGIYIQAISAGDALHHHNGVTDDLPPDNNAAAKGKFTLRGLTAGDYHLIAYDPSGNTQTIGAISPSSVNPGATTDMGNLSFTAQPADPNEPNNDALAGGSSSVNTAPLRATPSQPWTSSGAVLGPSGANDIDWYCFEAVATDRYFITVASPITIGGITYNHPWFDPIVSWRTADGTLLKYQDDGGPDPFGTRLDTGVLTQSRRYCAVVSVYGDSDFNGQGQLGPWGAYEISIAMGNRQPTITVALDSGFIAPVPPGSITIEEGQTLTLTVYGTDPDNDPLVESLISHKSVIDSVITSGVFDETTTPASYTWTASPGTGAVSPYRITFGISDGEFINQQMIIVNVNGVDTPPAAPHFVGPFAGICNDVRFGDAPPSSFALTSSLDAAGRELNLQLQVFDFADDVSVMPPRYDVVVPQDRMSSATHIRVDPNLFNDGAHYKVRRAPTTAASTPIGQPATFG